MKNKFKKYIDEFIYEFMPRTRCKYGHNLTYDLFNYKDGHKGYWCSLCEDYNGKKLEIIWLWENRIRMIIKNPNMFLHRINKIFDRNYKVFYPFN